MGKKIYQGYWVLVSTFILNLVSVGVFNTSSLYLTPLKESFEGVGNSELALFSTVQVVVGLAASMGGGPVQDYLADRGMDMPLQFAIFTGGFLGLGLVWSSFSTTLFSLLIGAILIGIGVGAGAFISSGVCVLWFEKNRGSMLLLAMSGRGVGQTIYSMGTSELLAYFKKDGYEHPWSPTMQICGIVCLIVGAAASIPMRLPLQGEVEEHEGGEEAGAASAPSMVMDHEQKKKYGSVSLQEGGGVARRGSMFGRPSRMSRKSSVAFARMRRSRMSSTLDSMMVGSTNALTAEEQRKSWKARRSSMAEFSALSTAPIDLSGGGDDEDDLPGYLKPAKPEISFNEIFFSKTSICLNIWCLVTSFSFLNFQVHLPAYTETQGMPDVAGTALSVFGIGLLAANLTLGPVSDVMGANTLLILSMYGLALCDFLWPYCQTSTTINAVSGVYGYLSSTNGCLPLVIVADAFSDAPSNHILLINGMLNVAKCPGYLFGPSIAGYLFERSKDWGGAVLFTWLTMFLGSLFLFAIPRPKIGGTDEKVATSELQVLNEDTPFH